jgi:general secretion pathway protein M
MIGPLLRTFSPRAADAWDHASLRERRLVAMAAIVVALAIGWTWLWRPMLDDIARMRRDQPREQSVLAATRAQAADLASLQQQAASARTGDMRAGVERILAERGLRAAASTLDVQDGRIRLAFPAVRFDALMDALDALSRTEGLHASEATLTARVEPGTVRAELTLTR